MEKQLDKLSFLKSKLIYWETYWVTSNLLEQKNFLKAEKLSRDLVCQRYLQTRLTKQVRKQFILEQKFLDKLEAVLKLSMCIEAALEAIKDIVVKC